MLMRQLEYLSALSREGHFGRAAETCHVSQPALSAGIRKLETELGVQIVQRGQRFEGFTPEGEQVLRWGQRILAEREALGQTLSSMRAGLSGVLRIGAIPTAMSVSSLLTTPMREQHPMVRFSLESMSSREIASRLNDFDIDVGMTYVDGEPLGRVRVVPLYCERYLFLTPNEGDHSGRESITWAEAASAQLCLLMPVMQNRRVLDGFFAEAERRPSPWSRRTLSRRSIRMSPPCACPASFPTPGCTASVCHTGRACCHSPDLGAPSMSGSCWPAATRSRCLPAPWWTRLVNWTSTTRWTRR